MVIHYRRSTRPSGRALARELYQRGYNGPGINFGELYENCLNAPQAVRLASNKKQALYTMRSAGVPVPALYEPREAIAAAQHTPLVGRPSYHRKGRHFYLCQTPAAVPHAISRGATHFLEYIEGAREFRVHVVNGKSIKISEKLGGGVTRNFEAGARFYYPEDFHHKKTLRRVAKQAVEALGLDFGAVDVLWKDGNFFVLEVNTAPCLTNQNSDTLARYGRAIQEAYDDRVTGTRG
ncbi:MAG TPA: hypothetical protein VFK03_03705 [Candidatus Saccharimonadales bacterium]|nr:hypothetical protein [Candidatus Saccharimonadales bacterium]